MPTPPKNRIEVDLKLLSDKDSKLLKELTGDLKTIINSRMVFGTVAQQMNAAQAAAPGGGGKPYLSDAYKQQHSTSDPGKYSRNVASNYDDFLTNQRSKFNLQHALQTNAISPGNKPNDMEFLNLSRYGDFTAQDILKQISYAFGKFGFSATEKDENGNPLVTRKALANVSGAFGMAAHSYPYARSANKIAARIRNHIAGYTAYGMSVGMPSAGAGVLGTPLLSPAYRTGLETKYQSLKRTWGGLNPNYSSKQNDDANNAAAAYGYDTGSDRGQFFVNQISNLQRGLGLSGDEAASMLDPTMRFGGGSVSTLTDALINMGRAAGQAGVNVQQLTLQAQQFGEQAAASWGGFAQDRVLQAGGLGTIFQSPQLGGGLANDNTLQNMVVAQKGGYYQAAFSHTKAQDTMHALQTYMRPFGGNFTQLGNTLKHGTTAQKNNLMNNLIAAQHAGVLPAGMTATQFAQQLMRGGGNLMKSAQATDLLSLGATQHHLSHTQMTTLEKDVVGKNWRQWASDHANDKDKLKQLNTMFGQHQGAANRRAATKVRIVLDPTTAKYIKAFVDSEQNKSAHSNSDLPSRAAGWAMGAADSAGGVANDTFFGGLL